MTRHGVPVLLGGARAHDNGTREQARYVLSGERRNTPHLPSRVPGRSARLRREPPVSGPRVHIQTHGHTWSLPDQRDESLPHCRCRLEVVGGTDDRCHRTANHAEDVARQGSHAEQPWRCRPHGLDIPDPARCSSDGHQHGDAVVPRPGPQPCRIQQFPGLHTASGRNDDERLAEGCPGGETSGDAVGLSAGEKGAEGP